MLKNGDLHHMGRGQSEGHPDFFGTQASARIRKYSSALAQYCFALDMDVSRRRERSLSRAPLGLPQYWASLIDADAKRAAAKSLAYRP